MRYSFNIFCINLLLYFLHFNFYFNLRWRKGGRCLVCPSAGVHALIHLPYWYSKTKRQKYITFIAGVGRGKSVWWRATDWTARVRFPAVHVVQTDSRAHPTSYPMGTVGSFSGCKRQGREADHSPPSSAKARKVEIGDTLPLPHMSSWHSV
jgi:hypothetical protein